MSPLFVTAHKPTTRSVPNIQIIYISLLFKCDDTYYSNHSTYTGAKYNYIVPTNGMKSLLFNFSSEITNFSTQNLVSALGLTIIFYCHVKCGVF